MTKKTEKPDKGFVERLSWDVDDIIIIQPKPKKPKPKKPKQK